MKSENSVEVDREELLTQLRAVEAGLAKKGIVEKTDCITFRKGRARTHNTEITASAKVSIPHEGCVKAKPLLGILEKLPDKKLMIDITENKMLIKGRRKLYVAFPTESVEPFMFAKVDRPKEWRKLHPDFCKALQLAQYCAGTDEKTQYLATFIKIGPDMIAALDNVTQSLHWQFKDGDSGVLKDGLYKAESIRHVLDIEPSEVCETPSWIHFRNGNDVVFSCLQHEGIEKFPDLTSLAKFKGHKAKLPKSLAELADCAGELTKDNKDENFVRVRIMPGKTKSTGRIIVIGESDSGKFRRIIPKVKYSGPSIIFALSSKLLREIVTNYNRCYLSDERMRIQEGAFSYVVVLQEPRKNDQEDSNADM